MTVNIKDLCRLLAGDGHEPLSEMAISQFVKDGMPKAARGTYDPLKCMPWYIGRLRTAAQARMGETKDGKIVALDEAQRRLTLAKAENEEMTAKERRGELVPLELHVAEQAKLATVVKQKMLNLPARIAPKLVDLSRNETKALLTAAVKAALSDLAKLEEHGADRADTKARRRARA